MTKRRREKLHRSRGVTFPGATSSLPCMNAILVTGATGNVGRPLVTQLASAGVEVRAVTRQPDTARFPDGVKVVGTAAERSVRRLARYSSIPARSATNWARVVRRARPRRCHAPRCALGDQRRRRLLAPAIALPRRPQQGGRAARRRLRFGVGEPAPNRVHHQLLRHVGAADPGRRCGQRPVRDGVDRAYRRPRHLRCGGARRCSPTSSSAARFR